MEIGSIYEINPKLMESAAMETAEIRLGETEKYGKKYIRYTASGREAIAFALKSLMEKRPWVKKCCLLPAYMCDSVFFPIKRAGWEMHFYKIDKNLEAEKESLCRMIENIRPGLLFIHAYYGVDTWKPMRSLLNEWRKLGICIMEDVTQSYYLPEAGAEADYVVGSLRKWYPVPDGGFVASDISLPEDILPAGREFTQRRMELLTEKWEYLHGDRKREDKAALKTDYLKKNREAEEWLDTFEGIHALSAETAEILRNIDEEECKDRRNANYACLSGKIRGKTSFHPIFPAGQKAAAPLYFPIYAAHRDGLQEFLRLHDIYAPVLWPVGRENADSITESEDYIYGHMLALPIDQRYGKAQMERIVQVLEEYEKAYEAGGRSGQDESYGAEVIGIRADANETVATGHIMRCLTIARQLKDCGRKVIFFTADEYAHDMLTEAGMEYICLNSRWNGMEEETEKLLQEMKQIGCRKLLVDSYQVTKEYFERLQKGCRLIYIDDEFKDIYPVDMIINYNAFYIRFPYKEAYGKDSGRETKLLLGTEYVPLREEFFDGDADGKKSMPETAEKGQTKEPGKVNVLLTSGGGDIYRALAGILTTFHEGNYGKRKENRQEAEEENLREQIVFHVVAGRFYKNGQELQELAAKYTNIKLYFDVKNMADLMRLCDVAVSAAGTMLFELCAMEVPAVFFVSADNQRYDSEFFAAEERMLYGGDMRNGREACLKGICTQLEKLLADGRLQKRMKAGLHKVTDGKGAKRIAEEIAALQPVFIK